MKVCFSSFCSLLLGMSLMAIIAGPLGCLPGDIRHKSDAEMMDNFRAKEDRFEQLLDMVRHDEKLVGNKFFRIDYDWTEPKELQPIGISDERVSEYRKLFVELGVPRGFNAYGKGDVYYFIASTQGLAVSGSSKSYVWRREPPEYLVNEDTKEHVLKNETSRAYRHIHGQWYLSFEAD